MNLGKLFKLMETPETVIEFCQENNLIAKTLRCPKCHEIATIKERNKTKEGYSWRCLKASCRQWTTLRHRTFFSQSKLPIGAIVKLIYLWAFEMASEKNIKRECGISSKHAICEWKKFVRNICQEYFMRHPRLIGGPGHTVEIDACLFNRTQHHVGRLVEPQWIFGGYDPTQEEGFLIAVPNRNAETLIPLIKAFILPGTTVVSDCWRAYNRAGSEGYKNLIVKHSLNFVEPTTKETTNHVKIMWEEAKRRNKRECGTNRQQLDTYLLEFMWRQKFGDDPFVSIINQIAEYYPVGELLPTYSNPSQPSLSPAPLQSTENTPIQVPVVATTTTVTTTTNPNLTLNLKSEP